MPRSGKHFYAGMLKSDNLSKKIDFVDIHYTLYYTLSNCILTKSILHETPNEELLKRFLNFQILKDVVHHEDIYLC